MKDGFKNEGGEDDEAQRKDDFGVRKRGAAKLGFDKIVGVVSNGHNQKPNYLTENDFVDTEKLVVAINLAGEFKVEEGQTEHKDRE